LDDGAETDLDLGHYERFIDNRLTRVSNFTTGQVYAETIAKERRGDFLGGTIQVIPHITNEIKRRIGLAAKETGAEIMILEVGGTVGDIESQPFLEALRQLRNEVGRANCIFVHVTWLPTIGATGEIKTKPTQHSVAALRSIGISPNIIIARADQDVDKSLCEKIALFCDVEKDSVIPMKTADVLYEVPLLLEKMGVGELILTKLGLTAKRKANMKPWQKLVADVRKPKPSIKVALVGKYVELQDAYMSVREALKHAALANEVEVEIGWVHSADLEKDKGWDIVKNADAVLVPGGFGSRGIEGKILAARYARENKVPYLGLCLGMQVMCIDFARNVLGHEDANSSEFDRGTEHPVIDLMLDQRSITDMGGTMRLGLYPCLLQKGTKAAAAYGVPRVDERHRHRFEFNNSYRAEFEKNGMVFSGISPDGRLIEIVELADHPYMVASQFHPEFLSRPMKPHPLFVGLLKAAKERGGK
jgi:CTP synthase